MEIFQEPTFTAFVALILSFVVAKIVSFAVSCNNGTDCDTIVCCVDEGKEGGALGKELRVGRTKGNKRVKFVDDAVTRRVDYVVDSVGEEIVEEREKFGERVDQIGEKGLGELGDEQCFDGGKIDDDDDDDDDVGCAAMDEGCEKVGILIEGESDGGFGGKEENSAPGSVVIEDEKNVGALDGDDVSSDQRDGIVACGENEGPVTVDEEEKREGKNERVIVDEVDKVEGVAKDRRDIVGDGDGDDDDDDDDDWEGIERTELEKVFAEAVNYAEYGDKGKEKEEDDRLAKLGSDVQMELYGLHKVAVEGPCHEPQPMALKVLARAKWNAWQRLGSMSREAAMEQYIRVLSDSISGWTHNYSADDNAHGSPDLEMVAKVSVPDHKREPKLGAPLVGNSSTGTPGESLQSFAGDTVNMV